MRNDLVSSLEGSFQALWNEVITFIPDLVVAIIVVVVGWIIGTVLQRVVQKLFRTFKLTNALDKAGVDDLTQRAGIAFKPARFVGSLVKWFVIAVFLVVAFDVLGLNEVTAFFTEEVLTFIPLVIVASLILIGGVIVANLVQGAVESAARTANFKAADMVGRFAKYAVLVFAVLAALNQVNIATELVQMLFAGLVFALSLALGLSFGLGGRSAAGKYIEQMTGKSDDRSERL